MNGLTTLTTLIRALNSTERAMCKSYLTAFDSRGEKFDSKSLKLFELLCNHKDCTERELEFLLYGKKNTEAFSRLVLRLRDKLLEAVTLSKNSSWLEGNHYDKALSVCRNKLQQAAFLLSRNLTDMASLHLSSVCDSAEHYEFFAEWNQALELLPQTKTKLPANYARQLNKVQQQFHFCMVCTELLSYAQTTSTGAKESAINELKTLHKSIGSYRTAFLILEIEAITASKSGHLRLAVQSIKKQIKLINATPALQNGEKLRSASLKLALSYFQGKWIYQSLEEISYCHAMQGWSSEERKLLLQTETHIHLLMNNSLIAAKVMEELEEFATDEKTLYLKLVLHFQRGEYAQANELLEAMSWKYISTQLWGAAVPLFSAMVFVELNTAANGKTKYISLKRLLRKLELFTPLNTRTTICFDLLKHLSDHKLDFMKVYKEHLTLIDQLRDTSSSALWEPESGEIILFHEWIISKALKVPLNAALSNLKQSS
jgi:hypothetical protein